jgi:hypothetical protein
MYAFHWLLSRCWSAVTVVNPARIGPLITASKALWEDASAIVKPLVPRARCREITGAARVAQPSYGRVLLDAPRFYLSRVDAGHIRMPCDLRSRTD